MADAARSTGEASSGARTTVVTVRYENPLEVLLIGSGMFIAGVILAARTARDWSAARRTGVATAREAEARMTEARADLYEHLVNEAKRGQTPVRRRPGSDRDPSGGQVLESAHRTADFARVARRVRWGAALIPAQRCPGMAPLSAPDPWSRDPARGFHGQPVQARRRQPMHGGPGVRPRRLRRLVRVRTRRRQRPEARPGLRGSAVGRAVGSGRRSTFR